jgi:hypothetical protein
MLCIPQYTASAGCDPEQIHLDSSTEIQPIELVTTTVGTRSEDLDQSGQEPRKEEGLTGEDLTIVRTVAASADNVLPTVNLRSSSAVRDARVLVMRRIGRVEEISEGEKPGLRPRAESGMGGP